MRIRHRSSFSSVRTEGAILPPDLLERVQEGDGDLGGLKPSDYHLQPGERLNEVVSRSWNRMLGAWRNFRSDLERLPEGDPGTTVTRERLLLVLFQELGYGRLQTSRAMEVDGKSYPVSHNWNGVPIHLVGARVELDRRTPGVAGAARSSPHSMMQELLNRSDDHLWAFLSNGDQLRILRDNISLVRQAYVEFDLHELFEGEAYADFTLLWMLCHESRVEAEVPEEFWLERWSQAAQEEGARALDQLRDGVEAALRDLGQGFLAHPANQALRDRLRSGTVSGDEYYRQLLRLVYRLIFLFAAEDRDLLHPPGSEAEARQRYRSYYSTNRLRGLAGRRRGTRHEDLYQGLKLVMNMLGREGGCPELALPALGSFLWLDEALPDLEAARVGNHAMLDAVRSLAYTTDGGVRRAVDYKNMGAEELGSVYEALLELQPEMNTDAGTFELKVVGGSERKTTGSYYTPSSLIQQLLNTALDPVIEDRLAGARRMANGDWRDQGERAYAYSVISGFGNLAAWHGDQRKDLHADKGVSSGGALWDDIPDAQGGGLDSGKHRRGVGQSRHQGIPALPTDRAGQPEGTGDAPHSEPKGGSVHGGGSTPAAAGDDDLGQADADSDAQARSKSWQLAEEEWDRTPLAIRRHLLASRALLDLKICDPACGSGHFLIAAAHRMAKHLAAVQTGDPEPSPEATRAALRQVIGRCIYGVDINPMAVELCKVNLWLEALEPGKPLSFLDHRIQCGNSLLGATPALIEGGIPDDAFRQIEGDDREFCKSLRKQNKAERAGQMSMFDRWAAEERATYQTLTFGMLEVAVLDEDTLQAQRQKEEEYGRLIASDEYRRGKLVADAWCAAFFWPKREGAPPPVTQAVFRKIAASPENVAPETLRLIDEIAYRYRLFHWHLAFPDVFDQGDDVTNDESEPGWAGGFDVVLGNPPWEHTELKEKEWFAGRRDEIAEASTGAKRKKMIRALRDEDLALYRSYIQAKREHDALSHFARHSGRYPLCGRGRINTYTVFTELNRSLIDGAGRVGCIVPSGIATDDTTKYFFQDLMDQRSLVSLYDFENKKRLFPATDSRTKFCLLTLTGPERPAKGGADFVFFAYGVGDLREDERHFTLTAEEIELLNPNTRTCPIFRSKRDAEITKAIYRRVPVLIKEGPPEENPWGITFKQGLFNMTSDSHLFRTREQLENEGWQLQGNVFHKLGKGYLPLYEAKMIHHFDHRFGDFRDLPPGSKSTQLPDVPVERKQDPSYVVLPRYWVPEAEVEERLEGLWNREWLLGWRDITNTTNERTVIVSIVPRMGVGHTMPLMMGIGVGAQPYAILANLAAFGFDYVARQKVGGTHLTYNLLNQLPALPPAFYRQKCSWHRSMSIDRWLCERVVELTYDGRDIQPFASSLDYSCNPFVWDQERRFNIRCELNAAFFHMYELDEGDVDYTMNTFPIVKRHDEEQFGEYRTKRVILEIYAEMQRAIETGEPYQTRLDPPPADPRVAHG